MRTLPSSIVRLWLLSGFVALNVAAQTPAPGAKCPSLAGRYVAQWDDGRTYLTIVQPSCEGLSAEWFVPGTGSGAESRSAHTYVLDGAWRSGGSLEGAGNIEVSVHFERDTLVILTRPPGAPISRQTLVRVNAMGDLCIRLFDARGNESRAFLAARQQGGTRVSEDSAARRSEDVTDRRSDSVCS